MKRFKHGLRSTEIAIPGEDPVLFERLRAELRAQHQPATHTEEILVEHLAYGLWRTRRFLRLAVDAQDTSRLEGISKSLKAARQSVKRALKALEDLQKSRGFVPQNSASAFTEMGYVPFEAAPEESGNDSSAFDLTFDASVLFPPQ